MVTAIYLPQPAPGRLTPPRSLPLLGLVPALLLHGGILLALLLPAPPTPQPALPVFEILLQPTAAAPAMPAADTATPDPAAVESAQPAPTVKPLPDPAPPRPRRQPQQTAMAATTPAATVSESTSGTTATPTTAASPVPIATADDASPPYAPVLLDWLGRHRDYPRTARLRRQEGTPRIALTIDGSGHLLALTLSESSGFSLLDDAALDMARRAAPFPPPALPHGTDRATFVVPVQFALQR